MKKKQESGLARNVSEDDLRKEVEAQMKSDIYQKMDKMIENLKRYREDFRGSRVPTFLMSKQQLHEHRKTQNLMPGIGEDDLSQHAKLHRSGSSANLDDEANNASRDGLFAPSSG